VRSSSLFEDAFMQPFAGVYASHVRAAPRLEAAARADARRPCRARVRRSSYSLSLSLSLSL